MRYDPSRCLLLVREGYSQSEIADAFALGRQDAERAFMMAVNIIDDEARRERRKEIQRAYDYRRRYVAGSGRERRCS